MPELPIAFWPDSWLWAVRSRILKVLIHGPGPFTVDGLDWIDRIEAELSSRGFHFERTNTD